MTADLFQQLYEQSFSLKLFWLEDINTALLASTIRNVTFIQFNSKYTTASDISNRKDHILIRYMNSPEDLESILKYLFIK